MRAVGLLLMACGLAAPAGATEPVAKPRVKLAVLVVFDQFRGDFLPRWNPYFGPDGFRRIVREGAYFPDCHYPYAGTSTGPGHASILAGVGPDAHGIIENSWYDATAGEEVYCAGSARYQLVPDRSPKPDLKKLDPRAKPPTKGVGNPDRFLGNTLADELKSATGGKAKVFGLSLKDRSAILPAGRRPDGVYWFEGEFLTSTYYRDSLPEWVRAFNESGVAESYFGKDWTRFRTDIDYTEVVGPDDAPGEGTGVKQGVTFPHPTTGGDEKPGKNYYNALVNSPFGNDLLIALAKKCVEAEQLGQDDVPDLLTISFSSNDLVGHAWGPDSHEVFDTTLRSDAQMADLLKFLDEKVGPDNYSLVVTADHGVCPIPEVAAGRDHPEARRVSPNALFEAAEAHLVKTLGQVGTPATATAPGDKPLKGRWLEAVSPPGFTLNRRHVAAAGLDPAGVRRELADFLAAQPGLAAAYTREQLLSDSPPREADRYWAKVKRSYHPDRSADVIVVPDPYFYWATYATGTGHGTPHDYDTHSVFLAKGPGFAIGTSPERITPLHAGAILARSLGIAMPKRATYGLPEALR